ncbi:MAG: hypothetical protein IPM45_17075 [Acidimicrobiales bacterium]|nr:hypothetical protein [Acidimicrobiales bacterium]
MPIEVETKDCTSLSDAELADMGDICAGGPARFDFGLLSKQQEEWVLITLARVDGKLHGFSFCTLERIGGTPSVLIGLGSVKRSSKRESVLRAIVTDQLRRAVLAFPDEDVLVGTRLSGPGGFEVYKALVDVVPRPGHKATGEERAWGRRLVKRFGSEGTYDDRTFVLTGEGSPSCVLDHESLRPEKIDADVVALFDGIQPERGDCLIAFGWALADDLLKLQP